MTEQPVEDFTLLSTEQTNAILATTELNANDRCDGCGAQAYVVVATPSGSTLLMCGHHFTKAGSAVTIIRDDRSKLLARNEPAFTGV
jgi:hypothetical protein